MKHDSHQIVAASMCAVTPHNIKPKVVSLCEIQEPQLKQFIVDWNGETEVPEDTNPPALSNEILRGAGIARPGSAARSSIYAAYAARALLQDSNISGEAGLGVITISTTATPIIAARYESIGFKDGWNLVDPFLLPNSIPSALATHVASAVRGNRFAVSLIDGAASFSTALEMLMLAANTGTSHILVLAVEEANSELVKALRLRGRKLAEGCLGLLFSAGDQMAGWRLTDIACEVSPRASIDRNRSYDPSNAQIALGTSFEPIFSLLRAFASDAAKAEDSYDVKDQVRFVSRWERNNCN